MVENSELEDFQAAVTDEDEWGNDLASLRYNLSLTPDERWNQYVAFANSVVSLVDAARSPGLTQAGRGLGL
jgi:hypothetical protein